MKFIGEKKDIESIYTPQSLKNYVNNNLWIVFWIVLFAILSYGYEITNFTLSIDEEIWMFRDLKTICRGWIGDGRWGISLLKLVIPSSDVLPFWNSFVSILIMVVTDILLCKIYSDLGIKKNAIFAFAILFISSPIISYVLYFSTFSVEVSIGYLFAVFSIENFLLYIKSNDYMTGIKCIIFLTIAIAIYQSLLLVFMGGVISIMFICFSLDKEIKVKTFWGTFISAIIMLIVSMMLYFGVNFLLQKVIYKSDYVNGYFRWSCFPVKTIISQLKDYALSYFFLFNGFYYGDFIKYVVLGVSVIIIFWSLMKSRHKILCVILVILLNGVSLGLVILMGGSMPIRTFQAYSLVSAFLIMIFIEKIGYKKLVLLKIGIVVCCTVSIYQSAISTKLFYTDNLRLQRDIKIAYDIAERISSVQNQYGDMPVSFIGGITNQDDYSIKTDMFGYSFLVCGNGRLHKFMSLLGYSFEATNQTVDVNVERMPCWPDEDSVFVYNDTIVVNLGTAEMNGGGSYINFVDKKDLEYKEFEIKYSYLDPEYCTVNEVSDSCLYDITTGDAGAISIIGIGTVDDNCKGIYLNCFSDQETSIDIYFGKEGEEIATSELGHCSFKVYQGANHVYIKNYQVDQFEVLQINMPANINVKLEEIGAYK